jgi:prepilin signal peptidase PulO-like enzyme (type II secretory pathway)
MNLLINILIFIILIYISYKDYRQRIIPDFAVLLVFILSSIIYFFEKGGIVNYFFYIFLVSVPMMLIGYLVDSIQCKSFRKADILIILLSLLTGILIPLDFKLKYVIASAILIISMIAEQLVFNKKTETEEEEVSSLGGGDIKLIAALGPVLRDETFLFLFIAFLLAFIFMKLKKEKNIYLAPFMCTAFVVVVILRAY